MLTAIGDVMRELHARGWITTRDGNVSLRRTGKQTLYVTPSGWRKTILHPEHLVRARLGPNQELVVPQGSKPSGELHMHYLLQKDAPTTRAVVHAHPTYTIAAMYRGFSLSCLCRQFPEIYRYTRVGPTVPPLPAVTKELGEATAEAFGLGGDGNVRCDIVGQAQHGVTAVAPDPWTAFEHIERLEHICQIVLASGVEPPAR
jgi:L-fuculose-phosphate aldolase